MKSRSAREAFGQAPALKCRGRQPRPHQRLWSEPAVATTEIVVRASIPVHESGRGRGWRNRDCGSPSPVAHEHIMPVSTSCSKELRKQLTKRAACAVHFGLLRSASRPLRTGEGQPRATSDTACTIDGATLLLHVSSDVASLYLPCGKLGISPYSRNSYAKPWSGLCLRQKAKVASGQTAAHDDFRGFLPVCSPAAVAERCQTGCAAIWQVYDERSNACACLPGANGSLRTRRRLRLPHSSRVETQNSRMGLFYSTLDGSTRRRRRWGFQSHRHRGHVALPACNAIVIAITQS